MSHFNARVPKRARGGSRVSRVEDIAQGSDERIACTQLDEEGSFMSLLHDNEWGGSLGDSQLSETLGGLRASPTPLVGSPTVHATIGVRAPNVVLLGIPTVARAPFVPICPTPPLLVFAVTGPPTMADVSVGANRGSKRPHVIAPMWNDASTATLLKYYEERWSHINKGNLRPKDWDDVTSNLNNETQGSYTPDEVRNCIDTLQKKYKKEKRKSSANGGVRSTWEYFEMVDTLWSTAPRCVGIPGAFDTSSSQTPIMEDLGEEADEEEGGDERGDGGPSTGDGGGEGADASEVRNSTQNNDGVDVAGVKGQRKDKRDHDERMLKFKLDEKTKRMDMYLRFQLDIAKILGKPQDGLCYGVSTR
ncbi:hypothetical protein L7F22_048705 [Adiantum nelumboides]|nr:hypothetical protein [Adiantum nelumboides]